MIFPHCTVYEARPHVQRNLELQKQRICCIISLSFWLIIDQLGWLLFTFKRRKRQLVLKSCHLLFILLGANLCLVNFKLELEVSFSKLLFTPHKKGPNQIVDSDFKLKAAEIRQRLLHHTHYTDTYTARPKAVNAMINLSNLCSVCMGA